MINKKNRPYLTSRQKSSFYFKQSSGAKNNQTSKPPHTFKKVAPSKCLIQNLHLLGSRLFLNGFIWDKSWSVPPLFC